MDFTPHYETVDSLKVRLKEMYDAVEIGNVKGIAWFVCWWGGNKMSFFENTKKPEGLGGKIMVAMMNSGHGKLADWGMSFLGLSTDAAVLDCGCGGGALLRGLDKRLTDKINIPFHIAEDPLHAVAKGTGVALKNVDRFSFLMR